MKIKNLYSQSGFSLIEVMIVVVLLGILSTIAILNLTSSKTDFQRQRIAREFKVYLERARFDSVKRRAQDTRADNTNDMANVTLESASSFTSLIDINGDGLLNTATEKRRVNFSNLSDTEISVLDTKLNYPITIRFNQRGQVIAKDKSDKVVNPVVFTICSKNCSGPKQNNQDLTVISVSTSGTVAVLPNDSNPSPLPTPSITSSPPQFNCSVTLANSNSTPPPLQCKK